MNEALLKKRVVVGFDGFIDTIVHAVDARNGNSYKEIERIADFGEKISSAAGKSANIELVPIGKFIGGNGPLMAEALLKLGATVKYIGTIGDCENNIFKEFARQTSAISIGDYSETRAVEFQDGKILFGEMSPLQQAGITQILEKISEDELCELIGVSDAVALVNWTMMTHLTDIVKFLLSNVLPKCPNNKERSFIFDLADPEKRQRPELLHFLQLIKNFENFGTAILGLNLRESQQVLSVTGSSVVVSDDKQSLESCAQLIQSALGTDMVFIHGIKASAAATKTESASTDGFFERNPKILTGAGDRYNAAFLHAHLSGFDLRRSVNFAAAASAFYVKNGVSAHASDIGY